MPAWFSKTDSPPCLKPNYATRRVTCPHCGSVFDAAARAVTLRCATCANQLQFENAIYSRPAVENITTLGQVRINRRGSLRGRVDCSELHVQGALAGNVEVRGPARIDARGVVSGTLTVRSIVIEPGGRFRGTLNIVPPE